MNDGLFWLEKLVKNAADEQAEIVCFPESYLPGYPGMGYEADDRSPERLQAALGKVCRIAAEHSIAIIVPMDWDYGGKLLNVATTSPTYIIEGAVPNSFLKEAKKCE